MVFSFTFWECLSSCCSLSQSLKSWSVISFVRASVAKAGRDLYPVKKSKICGSILGWRRAAVLALPQKITLFAFNLIALEKKRRRWSICFWVSIYPTNKTWFYKIQYLFLSFWKTLPRLWLFLILYWPTS